MVRYQTLLYTFRNLSTTAQQTLRSAWHLHTETPSSAKTESRCSPAHVRSLNLVALSPVYHPAVSSYSYAYCYLLPTPRTLYRHHSSTPAKPSVDQGPHHHMLCTNIPSYITTYWYQPTSTTYFQQHSITTLLSLSTVEAPNQDFIMPYTYPTRTDALQCMW